MLPSAAAIEEIQRSLDPTVKRGLRIVRKDGQKHLQLPWKVMLVCKVMLGNVTSVVTADPSRTKAEEGYDSLITPGRRFPEDPPVALTTYTEEVSRRLASAAGEEFLVFDGRHMLPLYLVWYETEH